ncbi:phosphatases II [Hanseniaspora valbyensis NRRL Y-1626]|uniref:Phosphatases II n=1 Tax=Hanseniaspora valbyensis NRRL Y-1626 TaxID=766949 RepID=A0A1B7T8U5_9ASCO|nr:phosphatases II [Hanseniaspora valbyensis NRRL Y-1626]
MYQLSIKYQRKILVYSQDGYSESSFLLLAYIIYSQNLSLKEAITYAHINLKRPFFIFPNDLEVLNYLQILLLAKSSEKNIFLEGDDMKLERFETELDCMINLKGPLPSQILEYLYLGSLKHANNLNLLKDLKINCVISVGEKLSWLNEHGFNVEKIESNNVDIYKSENMTVYHIDNLLDNGHDPLFHSLNDILKFIDEHRKSNSDSKILVHCMVGVSRSATVVIAEVMKELKLSLVRAYLYVRVRRLNIIIQPNLLFMYELLKYEEFLSNDLKIKLIGVPDGCKRSVDWACLSKSIDELNENYLK